MENTFEINEPVTIKITIEVIPAKKKEDIKEVPVVVKPPFISGSPITITPDNTILQRAQQRSSPEGWDAIEPETPTVVSPVEPLAAPEKKKRAYTRKTKTTEEIVKTPIAEEKKPTEEPPIAKEVKKVEPVNKSPTSINPNKVVARIAQMIRFYCKASGIEPSTITIAQLKEKAFDIVENVTDDVITEAIKEASKK